MEAVCSPVIRHPSWIRSISVMIGVSAKSGLSSIMTGIKDSSRVQNAEKKSRLHMNLTLFSASNNDAKVNPDSGLIITLRWNIAVKNLHRPKSHWSIDPALGAWYVYAGQTSLPNDNATRAIFRHLFEPNDRGPQSDSYQRYITFTLDVITHTTFSASWNSSSRSFAHF